MENTQMRPRIKSTVPSSHGVVSGTEARGSLVPAVLPLFVTLSGDFVSSLSPSDPYQGVPRPGPDSSLPAGITEVQEVEAFLREGCSCAACTTRTLAHWHCAAPEGLPPRAAALHALRRPAAVHPLHPSGSVLS